MADIAPQTKFIAKAIKRPGATREMAQHMGLIHGDQPLSRTILGKMQSKATTTKAKRRIALAKTLIGMHGG